VGSFGRWARGVVAVGVTALVILPACGGSSSTAACGSAPTPPIEPTTSTAQLTSAQVAELCDWAACTLGGYGTQHACGNGTTVGAEPNQAACENSFANATCTTTVDDIVACLDSIAGDFCSLTTSSACSVFLECATPN
jgi:hypothetical protein